ncbi:MAG: hypothetical protein ABIK09_05020 [Pseudomonadota bacterium]
MKTMKTTLLLLAMLLMAAPAMADEDMSCMSDSDCPEGYGCAMMSCACAECPPGEECLPCDCPEDGEGWCEDMGGGSDDWGFYGGECDVDGDCPLGFSCELVSMPCATEACPPCACMDCDPDDAECEETPCECPECPDPEPCDSEEMGFCVYDMVDCATDADCGEGFECLEVEECWASGGGCACSCACETCPAGEECEPCECPPCECDDEPDFEEGCDVVGSFCAPKEQPCETDGECLDGWECMMVSLGGGGTDCACPGCACAPCPEGEECEPCDCPPCECDDEPIEESVVEEGYCVPDGWSEIIEGAGGVNGSGSYEAARDAMAGELYGNGGTGEGDDKTLQLSAPEGAGAADDAAENTASGCATGQAAGAAPLFILLFALAALVLLPRRRSLTTR